MSGLTKADQIQVARRNAFRNKLNRIAAKAEQDRKDAKKK